MAIKVKALTKKQLDTLHKKLLEEKKGLVFSESTPRDLDLALPQGSDEIEQSISDYQNSHILRFRNREVFYLKKIDKALKKFERNEYGLCDECSSWIRFERLLARPTAELCIECKEESERDEQASFSGMQSKSYTRSVDLTGLLA
jgi:DnaK suppressor protein